MRRTDERRELAIGTILLLTVAFSVGGGYGTALPHATAGESTKDAGDRAPSIPARSAPLPDVQGTIEVTVDGRQLTFYSVTGEAGGVPYSSSTWMEPPSGGRVVGLGGFITDEPPFDAFERNAAGVPTSYGSYDGPVFGIVIRLTGDQTTLTATFPDDAGGTMLTYQPSASLDDVMTSTYAMQAGTLTVTDVGISGGVARAVGTFSGTFRLMAGDGTVEVTDGSFDVQGIPSFESLRR